MYVVTFYSYKGGVGRTMALVNTSIALARAGRRVLVVDFDLEAPGLPSYSAFQNAPCGAGIVDYVTAYRLTGAAPKASEYIYPCDVEDSKIWLMPAGHHTQAGYTEALNSIDWQDLYDHQDGYLMFEDLKQQWAQFEGQGFDYVLIDSRTGHTDVGGICTRQLPDAVVIMFVPNEQNIAGLVPIVNGIKAEKHRRKQIALEFCPSNVPDLDDEKEILSRLLADAKEKLGYKREPAAILHHYASLDILTQSAFVQSRPNSKLAKEYEKLRASIIALNFDDPEGALVTLERLPDEYERARSKSRGGVRAEIRAKAIDIRARHPKSGEIAFNAARVFGQIGEPGEQIEALTAAIDLDYELNRSRLSRSFIYSSLDRRPDALADLYAIIDSPTATLFEIAPALQFLQEIGPDWGDAVRRAFDRPDDAAPTLIRLATLALSHRDGLPAVADRLEKLADAPAIKSEHRKSAKNNAVLAMIGSGQYSRAKACIDRMVGDVEIADRDLIDLFNYLVADWGEQGVPAPDLLGMVIEKFRGEPGNGSNFHQCFALALALAGDEEGVRRELGAAHASLQLGEFEFSCWRYLYVDADAMDADFQAMRLAIESDEPFLPAFFANLVA